MTGPPDLSGPLDFSQFHATGDHWPFTSYCRTQAGGSRTHLAYAWEHRRRDQILAPWHWLCCRTNHHDMSNGWRRDNPDARWEEFTACRYCGKPSGS